MSKFGLALVIDRLKTEYEHECEGIELFITHESASNNRMQWSFFCLPQGDIVSPMALQFLISLSINWLAA